MDTDTASETIVISMLTLIAELHCAWGQPVDSLDATIGHCPRNRPDIRLHHLQTCRQRIVFQVNSLLLPLPLIRMSKLLNSESIEEWT